MKTLRKLGSAAVLLVVLNTAAFAGDPQPPACGPNPGETLTPPCPSLMATEDSGLAESPTPPASESFDFLSLAETALALVF